MVYCIGDAKNGDMLCGRYGTHNKGVKRLVRSCDVSFDQSGNVQHVCKRVKQAEMQELFRQGNAADLQENSQHYVDNAFFKVDFGGDPYGIFSGTPVEMLHALQLGIMEYVMEVFFDCFPARVLATIDSFVSQVREDIRQSVRKEFPTCNFAHGVTTLKMTTAQEKSGMLMMLVIVSNLTAGKDLLCQSMKEGKQTLSKAIGEQKLNNFRALFEMLLTFEAWMKRDSYWKTSDRQTPKQAYAKIKEMLTMIKVHAPRKEDTNGWNITKFHEMLHVVDDINRFGSPKNTDAGPCESNHKVLAKKPGRLSQKRHAVFDKQVAQRLADSYVIDYAYRRMFHTDPAANKTSNTTKHVLGGTKFEIEVTLDEVQEQYCFNVIWHTKASHDSAGSNLLISDDIIAHIGEAYNQEGSIFCYTEYSPPHAPNILYRAHPNYRSGGSWYDWAFVQYEFGNGEVATTVTDVIEVPGRLLCFFSEETVDDDGTHSEVMAVIQSCKYENRRTSIISHQWELEFKGALKDQAVYRIIPVDTINQHCLMIHNISAGNKHKHLVYEIYHPEKWADLFCKVV
jgi:hypothetical protein